VSSESVQVAGKYAPGDTRDVDSLREDLAAVGYAEASYPLYMGGGIFLLGAFLWFLGDAT